MIELSVATLPLAIRGRSQMLDRADCVEHATTDAHTFRDLSCGRSALRDLLLAYTRH